MSDIVDLTNEDSGDHERDDTFGPDLRSESPLSPVARLQLHTAILTCPEDKLRGILSELVERIPAVEKAIFEQLVTERPSADRHGGVEGPYIPRWEVCSRCESRYDVGTQRLTDECLYHSGELEVDEEMFADWDERCHGPMKTESNIREFPENFTWSCCEGDASSEGCTDGEHVPEGPRKKRARHW